MLTTTITSQALQKYMLATTSSAGVSEAGENFKRSVSCRRKEFAGGKSLPFFTDSKILRPQITPVRKERPAEEVVFARLRVIETKIPPFESPNSVRDSPKFIGQLRTLKSRSFFLCTDFKASEIVFTSSNGLES